MDSPETRKSQVFIAGFQNFDLYYIPANNQVVSQFRIEKSYPWQNSGASLDNQAEQEAQTESPDENLR